MWLRGGLAWLHAVSVWRAGSLGSDGACASAPLAPACSCLGEPIPSLPFPALPRSPVTLSFPSHQVSADQPLILSIYTNFEELAADYASGALHPSDLKPALASSINDILQAGSGGGQRGPRGREAAPVIGCCPAHERGAWTLGTLASGLCS